VWHGDTWGDSGEAPEDDEDMHEHSLASGAGT
jgi:hypothetical protein